MEATPIHTHKKIHSIKFGVFSPKMVKKMATAKVVTPELYDKEGYPVDGGLMDIRLGVIDPGLSCKTCGGRLKECIGHFGYIELARPVVHLSFVPTVLDILRGTCRECGRAMMADKKLSTAIKDIEQYEKEEDIKEKMAYIKTLITSMKNTTKCPHCKTKQQKISLEKPTTFLENEKRINPIEVRARLEKVSDEDLIIFGLNTEVVRPEWTILTVMLIPPVTMRPSITLESGERSEDDLTHKLGDIVRINQRLFENINAGAPEIIVEDLWDLLQYHVTTFFNNSAPQLPPARHRSGQPLKTLTERIRSKEGRIRHNLAGKRTNFSARTVISPDPSIAINEVGVPKVVAMKLTVPETVTEWNMKYLKEFVTRGAKEYPGANYISRPDGRMKKITDETKEQLLEEIQPGYVVERHLLDGDVAIFNRQPSLHRMSMMCHKVRVLEGRTFRLNPAVTNPYNADFDGDEMNLHIPQTEEARAEAEILMEVPTQIISPGYGLSVMGCKQDAVSGNYILTQEGFKLSRQEAIDILYAIGVDDVTKLGSKKEVTGKEIFSVLLPDGFDYAGQSKASKGDYDVIIKDGKLISGIIDSNNIGEGSGLLFRAVHSKFGAEALADLITKIFRLGIAVLQKQGFTTGLQDTDMPKEAHEKIDLLLQRSEEDTDKLIQQYKAGEMESFPGKTLKETLELNIMKVLNLALNEAGNTVKDYINPDVPMMIMANSGAKGKLLNMSQMSVFMGQQVMRGSRVKVGYSKRTLSTFKQGSLEPAAKGFIKRGFKQGLAPHEFFFGAMTGRDGLMDTALRTPKSGYLYRRLANAMQDLKVEYDGTVRDSNKRIIQFTYGEDSIDVSRSEGGIINIQKIAKEIGVKWLKIKDTQNFKEILVCRKTEFF